VYPFACLTSDIATALPRLLAVEDALAQPGTGGLLALLRLRSLGSAAPSMLRPRDEEDPPGELSLPQAQTSMDARSLLLEQGARLRQMPAFAGLSVAEAALLATLLQRVQVPAGQVITRQGDVAAALYIVESGEATVEVVDEAGRSRSVGSVGPGQCCGHVAVLDGAENPADVIARTDMTLLRLSKTAHDTHLARLPEVGERLRRDALRRLAEIDRYHRSRPARPASPPGECGCGQDCSCAVPGGAGAAPAQYSGGAQPAVTSSRR
jgi:hypothetical protein